ncbi:hypothetical protein [Sphingobacterium yanglingense]|uniref:Uncharacterized protein n=1 Tax=Sphingobacterium yanglingense TaxID=1437280 RepID=A0A4R6W4Z5_9SPHI|nr:hypothetical protein [Sphingobacterium yanglingense]TDQ73808.1 hypothetical protein CLV99_4245 [Sphingobacterium yanglingense]
MKIFIIMFLILGSFPVLSFAQSTWFKEWFRQNKTQREYLINQNAALRVYIGYARKGYEIYNKGLTTIGAITNGEFTFHKDYFNSLKTVNPAITKFAGGVDILTWYEAILRSHKTNMAILTKSHSIQNEEIRYVNTVYERVIRDCSLMVDELNMIVSNATIEMTDDQRIQRIKELHVEMKDIYTFITSFGQDAVMLSISRNREKGNIRLSRVVQE